MPADPLDLTSLNAAEREALALLASGHTAKSIATLTGRTEAAVNERLRDARRKTGVGSSRELARLLRDPDWASRTEEAMLARYRRIAGVGSDVQVRCARTICVVTGAFRSDDAVDALQSAKLTADMRALGFVEDAQHFETDATNGERFAAYWVRSTPASD
ncbi:MAG: hypothetical protein J0I47_13775 [Sphingomonas sp.]|uniref:hypothetical protein n=1 Tax=Sphingomonas sp. TaxID=28214 RepID=UPI001AC79FF1|nr:hypothetical protein [Sphingomonas sp.]MBN8809286.1 hypothetical protein [Sphingomonas sp.]